MRRVLFWIVAGVAVVGVYVMVLEVRSAGADEAQAPTVTVYKSPT